MGSSFSAMSFVGGVAQVSGGIGQAIAIRNLLVMAAVAFAVIGAAIVMLLARPKRTEVVNNSKKSRERNNLTGMAVFMIITTVIIAVSVGVDAYFRLSNRAYGRLAGFGDTLQMMGGRRF